MKRLLLVLILSLPSLVAQAKLTVEIGSPQIVLDRPFQLIITQTDLQQAGSIPNLMPLRQDFDILGTQRQASYSIINGQSYSSRQWIVSLKAKKTGVLTLPALDVGTEKTTPITINVGGVSPLKSQAISASQQKDVMVTTEVSHKNPYLNQQVIYTEKFYFSRRLLDVDYQAPQVDNALKVPLGDAKVYQTTINGTNYVVQEQNYAIFPQKSGPMTIQSPLFKVVMYGLNARAVQVQDKPITLDVEPIPSSVKGKNWLPAKQITLKQQYEHANQTLNQGSTLIRTIILEGEAIPGELLPKLQFQDNDAFSVYPEYGVPKTEIKNGQLTGRIEIKVTYLFKKSGTVSIPEIKLPWFNTDMQKEEQASLPPRVLSITPSVIDEQKEMFGPVSTTKMPTTAPLVDTPSSNNPWPWLVALGFALLWLLTLGLWGWQRTRRVAGTVSCKKSFVVLKKACLEGNPIKARDALLKWASRHWPDAAVSNLNDVTRLAQGRALKKQIHVLSEALYQKEDGRLWRGEELMQCVRDEKKERFREAKKNSMLPPLNPL